MPYTATASYTSSSPQNDVRDDSAFVCFGCPDILCEPCACVFQPRGRAISLQVESVDAKACKTNLWLDPGHARSRLHEAIVMQLVFLALLCRA